MRQGMDKVREVLRASSNIVVIGGSEVMRETGLNGVHVEYLAYDVEEQYGYSGDEIASSAFFNRQPEIFYDYYRNVILNKEDIKTTPVYDWLAKMEQKGKVSAIVTRMVYSLYQKYGCQNVIEVYGSAEENRCPKCGKLFDSHYIKESEGVPMCDKCGVMLKPGFTLYGEVIDNATLTKACEAIEHADVLLVVGTKMKSRTWATMFNYYEGDKLVLINTKESRGDDRANYRVYGNLSEIFKELSSIC